MEQSRAERVRVALQDLIAEKQHDEDKLMFDEQLETIKKASEAGVYVTNIWQVLRDEGFSGGKEKLVKFMVDAGIRRKTDELQKQKSGKKTRCNRDATRVKCARKPDKSCENDRYDTDTDKVISEALADVDEKQADSRAIPF